MADRQYERIRVRPGVTLNRRTAAMLAEVEQRVGKKLALIQGSYNPGKVSASAGVHDRGGAVDLWLPGASPATINQLLVKPLRLVGFAAWYRPAMAGVWGAHVHAVAIGDAELSPQARAQVSQYRARKDGLAGHGPDTGPRVALWHTWKAVLLARQVKQAQRELDAWITSHS